MAIEQLQPWIDPDETVEAIELMQEAAEVMRNTAKFGSMRKELRTRLENQADILDDFVRRAKIPRVDGSVMLALDAMARERKTKMITQITEALEGFVSSNARRK